MAGRRRKALETQHACCGIRAHSAVVGVSGVGMGYGRQRAGAGLPEEVRLGDGAQRAHTSDNAKGRRQRRIPEGAVDGVSSTATGQGGYDRTYESTGGATQELTG